MAEEIEVRFLDIDITDIRKKLKSLKAKKVHKMMLYRRYVFHLQNQNEQGFARVREEASGITITIKKYTQSSQYASEYEVKLGSNTTLEQARDFMIGAGFVQKSYQETLREKYKLPNINEVVIDVVPGLPPYIEIEAPNEEKMISFCSKLGLDIKNGRYGDYGNQFEEYYGILRNIANNKISEMRFKTIDKSLKPYIKKNKSLLRQVKKSNLELFDKYKK